jgi:hypothetical protein
LNPTKISESRENNIQQQQTTTPTNQIEERTVMSNLSPDDSAKTMMTNVSRMVETLGTVVNTLAKENANMARETANTNDTIKQMMIQQTETMNAFMMLMTRNEERRQEIPTRVIQQPSTPSSTITNSQYSQSQQSTSANKRKIDGIADDETSAISTVLNEPLSRDDDDIDAMLEEHAETIDEERKEQEEIDDMTMTDKDHNTITHLQQEQQETSTTKITTALAEGDFSHQFNKNTNRTENINGSTPTGVIRQ